MSEKPKILLVCDSRKDAEAILGQAVESHELVVVQNPIRALAHLTHEQFAGVYVAAEHLQEAFEIGKLLQNEQILEGMPDGVVLLDSDNTILWANGRVREWSGRDTWWAATSTPSWAARRSSAPISVPSTRPWPPARRPAPRCVPATAAITRSTPRRWASTEASRPIPPRHLIVTVRDVTKEILQQQKLAAIHQAGHGAGRSQRPTNCSR